MRLVFAFFIIIILSTTAYAEQNVQQIAYEREWDQGVVVVVYGTQYGTGWWVSPNHVVTAAHVVDFNNDVEVQIIKGKVLQGRVVAISRDDDLAVIEVQDAGRVRKHVFPLADDLPLKTSIIYVIGYPAELLELSGSLEEMSQRPRVLLTHLSWTANGLIEIGGKTDAGNSGGPVLDYDGNVVGVVVFAKKGKAATLYFAVDTSRIQAFLRDAGIPYEVRPAANAVAEQVFFTTSRNNMLLLGLLGITALVVTTFVIRGGTRA